MRCRTAENAGGAAAPMLNDFTGADKVLHRLRQLGMRKRLGGPAPRPAEFALDPFTNTLFLFCGRRRDRIKGLYWEKDGFILLYKRLEQGAYQWPRSESEVMLLLPTFQAGAGFAELTPEERYEKRPGAGETCFRRVVVMEQMRCRRKTAPKSALGRAIGSAPFLDFASKAYRKKARRAIHQV